MVLVMNDVRKLHRVARGLGIALLLAVPLLAVALDRPWTRELVKDEVRHFAYLHSCWLDGDLDFTNEYTALYPRFADNPEVVAATGRPSNEAAVGAALLWTPGFLAVHAAMLTGRALGAGVTADGYAAPYQSACVLAGSLSMSLGIWLSYGILRRLGNQPSDAVIGVALVATGTHYLHSWLLPGLYAHTLAVGLSTVFVYYWSRTWGRTDPARWAVLGLLGGLGFLVRWQNVWLGTLAAMFELCVLLRRASDPRRELPRLLVAGCSFAIVMALCFVPQLLVWRSLYGSWIVIPQGQSLLQGETYILELLFSPRYGLFGVSPLLYVSVLGLVVGAVRLRTNPVFNLGLLYVACAVLLNGALAAGSWYGGATFGPRRLDSLFPFMVIGAGEATARVVELMRRWPRLVFVPVLGCAFAATLILVFAYRDRRINVGMVGAGTYPQQATGEMLRVTGWLPTLPAAIVDGLPKGILPGQYSRLMDEELVAWGNRTLRLDASSAHHLGKGWAVDPGMTGARMTRSSASLFIYLMDLGYRYSDIRLEMDVENQGPAEAALTLAVNGTPVGRDCRVAPHVRAKCRVSVLRSQWTSGINYLELRAVDGHGTDGGLDVVVHEIQFDPAPMPLLIEKRAPRRP